MKNLVEDFFEKANKKEFEGLKITLAPNAAFYFPGTKMVQGPDKICQLLRVISRKYPDLTFTIKEIIIENNNAAVSWTNQGTDRQGNCYNNEGVTIIKTANGLITYLSDYFKDTSFTNR